MGAVRLIVDELRRRGVVVHEWPGWETRGNGGVKDLDVKGIIVHHTGSSYGSAYPELASSSQAWASGGALCNFSGNADGSVTVIAAGLTYHAGGGYGPNQGPLAPYADDRNRRTVGLEIVYGATGSEVMKPAQYNTALVVSRVVVDLFQRGDPEYVRAHAEVNGRGYEGKWDPRKGLGTDYIDMNAFRAAVRTATMEADVDLGDSVKTPDGRWVYVRDALGSAPYASLLLERQVIPVMNAMKTTLAAIAQNPDVTPEFIDTTINAAVKKHTPTADEIASRLDINEAVLAVELEKLGVVGIDLAGVKAAVKAAMREGTETE